MDAELVYLDATALAERISRRELSPVELLRGLRERAERLDPGLNALVTPIEAAETLAREAEAALARGDETGPLHGVPFTIKDSVDTAGVRTTRGSKLFADHVPQRDAEVVTRLRAAGGIPLAKTNLPDFVLWWETDNLVFGRTVNPWDPARTCGGSSGGEAAGIAAGLSPLGIGSDLGGSIRLPAHYCGVAGLKPTHGRVPLTGHWPDTLLRFMHVGFLARSVRDVALALSLSAGPDGADWHAVPVPPPGIPGGDVAGLRVGVVGGDFGAADPAVTAVLERAAAALADAGCTVAEAEVPGLARHDWNTLTMTMYGIGGGPYLDGVIAGRHAELHPMLQRRLAARSDSLPDYVACEYAVEELRRDVLAFFARHDVLLCPTGPVVAHGHDALEVEIDGAAYPARATMRSTIPWDLSGSPALSVPFGSSEGLPVGVQVVGRHFDEETVLATGMALERARGRLPHPYPA
ncbi:MAG: amidase [Thermoleophilia bacterium]|nr:amidase [Thermoleophilia bacterium]